MRIEKAALSHENGSTGCGQLLAQACLQSFSHLSITVCLRVSARDEAFSFVNRLCELLLRFNHPVDCVLQPADDNGNASASYQDDVYITEARGPPRHEGQSDG